MSAPWFKFYPTDWRSDPRLRMCSMAARGLWIEMIALMHEATPYGHLLVSGLSPTDAQLAVLAGAPSDQIPDMLGELEAAGVFSRTSAGVVYSRKMTRMAKKAAVARKNGKAGGNPSLRKDTVIPASDNPQDKGRDKPQKPEARSQITDPSNDGSERGGASLALDLPGNLPLPLGDPPQPPEPKRPRRKPELPLPDNWVPSDRNVADAQASNLSPQDIRREADRFRDHHLARGSLFRDWDAAWRTWVSRVRPSDRDMAGAPFPGRHGQGRSLASIAAARRLADAP